MPQLVLILFVNTKQSIFISSDTNQTTINFFVMLRKSRFKSVECKMMTPDHYHEREAEKEAKDYEESGAIVEMIKNKLSELADFSFVIGNFFTHCVTHDGKVVPAEGAVVEFSLEGGILAQWHCVLRSGPIPSGYRGQCTENAKKTHNIPIGSILSIYIISFHEIFG